MTTLRTMLQDTVDALAALHDAAYAMEQDAGWGKTTPDRRRVQARCTAARRTLDAARSLLSTHPESAPAPGARDAEARLRAFADRYDADFAIYSLGRRWELKWKRRYRDVVSDARQVSGDTLTEAVAAAEAWEAENDAREPQYAAPSPSSASPAPGEDGDLRERLARAERSEHERWQMCDGSCDIALARRQVGPDGIVPGNAKECAELWEREASRLSQALATAESRAAELERERYEARRSWARETGKVSRLETALNRILTVHDINKAECIAAEALCPEAER